MKTKQSYLRQPNLVNLNRSTFCLKVQYIAAIVPSPLPFSELVILIAKYCVVTLYITMCTAAPLRGNKKNHKFTNGSGDGTIAAISYLPSLKVRQP